MSSAPITEAVPKRRMMSCSIGPSVIPIYPVSAFSRLPAGIKAMELWQLVGPTVHHNINKPLWMQFVAVYFEGLNHGSAIERERLNGNV